MECGGPCVKDVSLEVHKRPSPSPWVVTQRKPAVWVPSPPVQGCSRLVAGVLWSEEHSLATEASPHSTSRHHIGLAISGPRR